MIPSTPAPLPQKETLQFSAQTRYSDGRVRAGGIGLRWSSSDLNVATVDSYGKGSCCAFGVYVSVFSGVSVCFFVYFSVCLHTHSIFYHFKGVKGLKNSHERSTKGA